jgi:hypothetical protein
MGDDSVTILCSFKMGSDLTVLPVLEQFLARAFLNAWYGKCGYVPADNPDGEIPFSPPAFLRNQPVFSDTSLSPQPWLN